MLYHCLEQVQNISCFIFSPYIYSRWDVFAYNGTWKVAWRKLNICVYFYRLSYLLSLYVLLLFISRLLPSKFCLLCHSSTSDHSSWKMTYHNFFTRFFHKNIGFWMIFYRISPLARELEYFMTSIVVCQHHFCENKIRNVYGVWFLFKLTLIFNV